MLRFVTRWCCLGVIVCAAGVPAPASAQLALRPDLLLSPAAANSSSVPSTTSNTPGELHGTVEDDRGEPLAGAVVSALGSATVFAVSDRDGRFAFRNLAPGPYLVRVHRQGYVPARGRVMQVNPGVKNGTQITLARVPGAGDPPPVLAAGVGPAEPVADPDAAEHEHDEVAWRLRHSRRSVLKDTRPGIEALAGDESFLEDSLSGLTRAVGSPARLATALFSDVPLDGQINLLTTTSLDRPQELFSSNGMSRGVAYVALRTPAAAGEWTMRGTLTQGDLSSWILAGSYARREPGPHQYEAGVSYSMQRYIGGNGEALAAMRDGSRNVGALYAYDTWTFAPRTSVAYGAKYASVDYLEDGSLVSPRLAFSVQPSETDNLTLRASVSRVEGAPGAEEFLPPAVGLWLPPQRTFSHVSRGAFRLERVDHVEVSGTRQVPGNVFVGVRTFRQRVDDQMVTLFGLAVADATGIGHYHVGSAGDFEARGWGLTANRAVSDALRVAVDYTMAEAKWYRQSADAAALARVAGSLLRTKETIHDVTASVESILAATGTRLYVVYKMNTAFAAADAAAEPIAGRRFSAQVNQSLPFLDFTAADWEMLVAVSNLFREHLYDGSVYDELLVMRPPKRVLGGVTVRF